MTAPLVSIMLHGSLVSLKLNRWYRPGSQLHAHLAATGPDNWYADAGTAFRWSGFTCGNERRREARRLVEWRESRGFVGFDTIVAHSSGGNLLLDAVESGESVKVAILLHTAISARPRRDWNAIRERVERMYLLNTRGDYARLACALVDRAFVTNSTARQVGRDDSFPATIELPRSDLRGWFSHRTFTKVGVWSDYSLAAVLCGSTADRSGQARGCDVVRVSQVLDGEAASSRAVSVFTSSGLCRRRG